MRPGFFRRNFRHFSTLAIVACFYLMLHKSSTTFKSNINVPTENSVVLLTTKKNLSFQSPLKEKQNEVLPIRTTRNNLTTIAAPLSSSSVRKIKNLPRIGAPSMDLNKTLNWLDLWSNDTFCNRFTVHLLEENLPPRALVSFPGSGNTWLRMLLMGVTGYYVDTIYPGDELFNSKGKMTLANSKFKFPLQIC
jgi:hypothetical protein